MKRTNRFLTAAALLILAALTAYTASYIWRSAHAVRTAVIAAVTVRREGRAEGILVRDEMVIAGGDDVTVIVAEDGERIAAGSTLAFSGARITATCSGIFLSQLDGYEHLSAAVLQDLTPDRLQRLLDSRSSIDPSSPGKLIRSPLWYFAAALPEKDAAHLRAGDFLTLTFQDGHSVIMTVEQLSDAADGVCAMVCSASELTLPLLQRRCETVTLLLGEYRGFSVPASAVFTDADGQACLYAAVGGIAELVAVDILYTEPEGGMLLVSPLKHNTLYNGSSVLTQPDRAYDGMALS